MTSLSDEIPSVEERVARLDDPEAVKAHGYGRGRTPGEALWSCLVSVTGFPYRGSGLAARLAERLGLSPQVWGYVSDRGAAGSVLPHLSKLGLVLVSVSETDHIVCHASRLIGSGWGPARFHHASARQLRDKRGRPVSRPEREA